MSEEFYRVRRLPPYVFAEVNRLKALYRSKGEDIIDFGMGNPDQPPPEHVIDKLCEVIKNPRVHGYSQSQGIPGLRKALVRYYERRFSVSLDFEKEVVVTLGSKEGLANLAQAITSPGDTILVPDPAYPIHAFGFIIVGASIRRVPVATDSRFFSALETAIKHSVPKPSVLVVNFPSNPTAEVADLHFYKELVTFCKKHDIYILSDLAYSEIYFDGNPPPSILEIPEAKDITVEFTSLSKTFSMAGWRIGFAAGNEKLIDALKRVKSYLDYGAFTPIQVAAVTALDSSESYIQHYRDLYQERRDVLLDGMNRLGWESPYPKATMFVWAPIPEPFKELGSLAFSKILLQHAQIAVSPGVGFGEQGEGYVRLGLVENTKRIRQALRNLKPMMENAEEIIATYKNQPQ